MTTPTKNKIKKVVKTKKVKAWAIIHSNTQIIEDIRFRKPTFNTGDVYKVVPVTITYKI